MQTKIKFFIACTLLLCTITSAIAAPYQLTVYSDDLAALGETEVETIFSVARPRRSTGLAGRVGQMLAEVSYGVAKNWAIGLDIPAVYAEQLHKVQGLAAEVQYVAPRDKTSGWYWGLRSGIGRIASVYEDDTALTLELNPIIGYRSPNYRIIFNPSLEKPLSGKERSTRFQPSSKFALRASPKDEIGFEYYGDFGHVSALLPPALRQEVLFAVWDTHTSFGRFNLGLGQAFRPSSGSVDKWVAKVGIQIELD
jgi:hypothetical protein